MFSSNTSRVSADANYIEDVFQTWLYTGNSTTGGSQTITNNVDLSTKGGLVWIKGRSAASNHILTDTTRGAGVSASNNNAISSNLTSAEDLGASYDYLSAFSTTGFTVTQGGTTAATRGTNYDSVTYASWTFRKQPKFFDVVTYTGNGANRTIAHNLGSVPGCIIIKRTDTTAAWAVYHRGLANTEYLVLNTTAAKATGTTYWNSTTPTATEFSLGTATDVNANTGTYVAYLFAHDAGGFGLTGTDNVISCGSFTADSTGSATVTLGYEPQWLLIKRTDAVRNWELLDIMRGFGVQGADNIAYINPNLSSAEPSPTTGMQPTATGFGGTGTFINNATHIYIAIRNGPMKVPTSGTSIYNAATFNSGNSFTTAGFPVDFILSKQTNGANDWRALDRLRGNPPLSLYPNSVAAESSEGYWRLDNNTGVNMVSFPANNYQNWMFQRAPGFFDVVCYTGRGSNTTQTHNLGVVPELMIVKRRGATADWQVYSAALSNTEYLVLNSTAAKATGATRWNSTTPTASVFSLGTDATVNAYNIITGIYVAYLFATCPGVSKVGSYTGSGTTKQIDCGFTNGARFVLIKRTDSTGDWYVWDTARGIVSGNDPYLLLNSTAAEVTNTDYIDTYSAGFELSSTAPAALNANGGSYIFLAIA